MKTRKTFLPLVAVALAMVVVAPSCSKDDDKPAKQSVVDNGVAKKAQDAAERAEQKAQKAEDAAKAAEKKLAEAEDAKRKAEEALAEAEKANRGVEEAKKAAEAAKKAADEAKTEAEEAKRAAGEAKAEAEKAKKAAEDAKKAGQKPGQTDPQKPGQTDPQKPGQTDPQKPGQTDPQKPGQSDPQKPGQTDPQQPTPPVLSPEQAKELVGKVDEKIKGQEGMAEKVREMLDDGGHRKKTTNTMLDEALAEVNKLKEELKPAPDGTERKAEVQGKLDILVEAIGVKRLEIAEREKAKKLGEPILDPYTQASGNLEEQKRQYSGTQIAERVKKLEEKNDFTKDGHAVKALAMVREAMNEVAEIEKVVKKGADIHVVAEMAVKVETLSAKNDRIRQEIEAAKAEDGNKQDFPNLQRIATIHLDQYVKALLTASTEAKKYKQQEDAWNKVREREQARWKIYAPVKEMTYK